jgi:hypothetical protein
MVAPKDEIARSHTDGLATKEPGPMSVSVDGRANAEKTQPINPMSWYRGNQLTPV